MSNDLVIFNVRCEKKQFQLKFNTPSDLNEFVGILKNELEIDDKNEIVILCPTFDGKMMEIDSNDDIEFLKENELSRNPIGKSKLIYNAISKEIYCNVELVVIVIHPELSDNLCNKIKFLSGKVNHLTSQLYELSVSLHNKIEDNGASTLKNIESILLKHLQDHFDNQNKNIFLSEQSTSESNIKSNIIQKKKSLINDKEKIAKPTCLNSSTSNNNSSNCPENLIQPKNTVDTKVTNFDTLLEMLVNDGFSNTIQNIIVLKRFSNDYEKAINYLKLNAT